MRKRSKRTVVTVTSVIAFVVAGLVAPQSAFAATYEVSRNHDADWHFERAINHDECPSGEAATGSHRFEPGPVGLPTDPDEPSSGAPPRGTGSLELATGVNGDSLVMFRNTRYAGTTLSQLDYLEYYTYTEAVAPSQGNLLDPPAIWIRLYIDKNPGDSVPFDDFLEFEPAYQDFENGGGQASVELDRWQRWIAHDSLTALPEGNWWLGSIGQGTWKSLEEWIATPSVGDAAIVNPGGRGGVVLGAGCGDARWTSFIGNTDAFSIRLAGETGITTYDMEPPDPSEPSELDCLPEVERARSGTARSITCTAMISETETPVADTHIDVEAIGGNDPPRPLNPAGDTPTAPDYTCVTTSNGSCTIHIPSSDTGGTGTTNYLAWIDVDANDQTVEADRAEGRGEASDPGDRPEPDDTDVVEKIWVASRLDCEPESAAPPLGSSHTVLCRAFGASGAAAAGQQIDVEASGANDPEAVPASSNTTPDFSCVTDAQGSCSVTHAPSGTRPNTTEGTTTYRAWIDFDGSNLSAEADDTEGVDATKSPGRRAEIDDTDVVEARWGGSGGTLPPCPTGSPSASPSATASPSPSPTGGSTSPSPSPTGGTRSPSPSPTGGAGSPSPTPTGGTTSASLSSSPCATPSPSQSSPSPTPSEEPSPDPSPTDDEPHGDPLMSGPCAGYFPGSRQPDPNGDGEIIVGTQGNDTLRGGDGDDTICGLGGKDTLIGVGGDDLLAGNASNDILRGNVGNDILRGAGGEDTLAGGAGADKIYAGGGDDILRGGGESDLLKGGGGKDVLRGRWKSDRLFGGKANDALNGGPGNDLQNGGPGEDVCRSGGGRDRFRNCE